jgi:acyl-CoA reductase-like NAD-dependent aldehyde dehydrogenase
VHNLVRALIEDAEAIGLTLLTLPRSSHERDYFIAPTIIDNPPDTARVVVEEQFGPIVPLLHYTDVDLAASVWRADVEEAARVAEQLDCGSVSINTMIMLTHDHPFGGHKQSGVCVEMAARDCVNSAVFK